MVEEKVLKTISKYELINQGDLLVCGVSGGPDSICMLDVLNKIKKDIQFELVVAHINHCIRDEAIEDEKFVNSFCKKNNIQCFIKRIDVENYANNNKIGTEEAGRFLRYEFFDEVLKKVGANKVAIAHNKNDNIETVFLNLMRGTGLSGLKGIEPKRNNKYIRPLIEISRMEIEEYCKTQNLNPCVDKTNSENIYTRNKVRNLLIPYIQKEFNPNIINVVNRLSEVIREEDEFLNKVTKTEYDKLFLGKEAGQIILDLKLFNLLDVVIKRRIIIYTIKELMGTSKGIEKVHVEDIINLCEKNIGNKFLVPQKNIKILIKNKKIFFISKA